MREIKKLENRYIVLKYSHMTPQQLHALETCLWENKIGTIDCVVIERGWPEYNPVVNLLFERINNEEQFL